MKAITFHGPATCGWNRWPIPSWSIRPTWCCASPPARCAAPTCTSTTAGWPGALVQIGAIMGHEFMGVVEEAGVGGRSGASGATA